MSAIDLSQAGATYLALAKTLENAFQAWDRVPEPWFDSRFDALALEVFALQFESNLPYARYCRAIGANPASIGSWREIPPAPTAAFHSVDLIVGEPADAALRFRTSGTTRGEAARGAHPIRRPATYRAALAGPFRHFVLASRDSARFLLLHSPFQPAAESSLAWMFDELLFRFGTPGSDRLDPQGGLSTDSVTRELEAAASGGEPAVVLGTTQVMAELLACLERRDISIPLPEGSRVMDTGGTKGRDGMDRGAVLSELLPRLGLGASAAVNEFGMTELLSQRYGPGLGDLRLAGPPWLRTRVLDPVTLEEKPRGEPGLLCHYDLANVGSVLAVLTEDRGRAEGETIEWLGRTPGAPPRGCSLATAELLDAQLGAEMGGQT